VTEFTESSSSHPGLWKRVVLWTALFLCLTILPAAAWLMLYGYSRGPVVENDSVVITIPKGTSVRGISEILGEAAIIRDDLRFVLLAKWQGVAAKLRAGEFQIPTGKTPLEVLELLVNARQVQHAITIPEGLRAEEIASIFAKEGWCDPYIFNELVLDGEFIAGLGLSGIRSLEGYLYPDTYYLTRDVHGAETVITLLVDRFHAVWGELTTDLKEPPDRQKTVILASIVEKETGDAAERPLIASVFHNRLKQGMRLQSDPTVVYGLSKYSGTISKADLKSETPYNTYVIPALPAGPIANPGKAALQAVLNPSDDTYLYFVSKNDGTHQFSTNLKDHNLAVQKFQRKNDNRNGKE
jgi:UPF0755 protein